MDIKEKTDPIRDYVIAYNGAKLLEAKHKKAKKILEGAKEVLLAHMDNIGTTVVKRNGIAISKSTRDYGKVVDFAELLVWVKKQDEPRSQFMEEVFIKGSSKDPRGLHVILKDAKLASIELGLPLEKCLPDGLAMSTIDILTVRKAKAAVEQKPPTNKVEQLRQELNDF